MARIKLGSKAHSISLRLSARSTSPGESHDPSPTTNRDISPRGVLLIHWNDLFMLELKFRD
jgi:hypothetical protein